MCVGRSATPPGGGLLTRGQEVKALELSGGDLSSVTICHIGCMGWIVVYHKSDDRRFIVDAMGKVID